MIRRCNEFFYGLNFRSWESLANRLLHARFLLRPKPAAIDAPPNGIKQLQPIFQGWWLDSLPLVIAPFPRKKQPIPPDMLDIDLQGDTLGCHSLPANFCLRHLGVWLFSLSCS